MTDDTDSTTDSAPDHPGDPLAQGFSSSTFDVERLPSEETEIGVYLDSTQYFLPETTAADWLRAFRDTFDGQTGGTPNAPDVEYTDAFQEAAGDVYAVHVGGKHTDYSPGWHLQSAFFDSDTFEDLIATLEDVLNE